MHTLKPKPAKLPLPREESDRIRHHRDLLDSSLEMIHDAMLITHAEMLEDAEDRKAARAARQEAANPPPPPAKPKPARNQSQEAGAKAPQTPPPQNPTIPEPAFRARKGTKPQLVLFYLNRALQSSIRLDAWLADRLAGAHTTAELAGLHHPNRQPILDYMHRVARFEEPYQFQRTTHDALETRISEELAWAPNRNPADIIVEICNHYKLPYDPNDFPNGWRPTPPQKPPSTAEPKPDYEDPDTQQHIYATIIAELENRRCRGLDD